MVGAGAGVPYGLPTGFGLRRRITRAIYNRIGSEKEDNDDFALKGAVGRALDDINALNPLGPALLGTSPLSIDALLERRPELLEVGKAAIAATLLRDEYRSNFTIEKGDWLGNLYLRLHGDFPSFSKNTVAFVTFNYDRLIEHRLTLALASHHGTSVDEAWEQVQRIPIIHIYGQLGQYSPNAIEDGTERVEFMHFQTQNDVRVRKFRHSERIIRASNGIHLIHERDSTSDTLTHAKKVLSKAGLIFFLGFGYDPTNLERLGTRLEGQLRRVKIVGSALGLDAGELTDARKKITNSFTGSITGDPNDTTDFPDHRLILQEDRDCIGALRYFSNLLQ